MENTRQESSRPQGVDPSVFPEWHEVEVLVQLSPEALDELPMGAIKLDAEGNILLYNTGESRISGRQRSEVVGKNFFEEVAPCTNVREFAGEFRAGVERRELNHVFPYTFDFRMRPVRVWIRLYYSEATESAWIFVVRRDADPGREAM